MKCQRILLAILAAAALAGCGDSAPPETGPLAIYDGEWNQDDGRLDGVVHLDGECFVLDSGERRFLLAFAQSGTAWDDAAQTVRTNGREFVVGSAAEVGGGGGTPASEIDWLVPPHDSCRALPVWFVNE